MLENHKVADLLRRFVEGSVDPYELDDFLSTPATDPELEQVRLEVAAIPMRYPPELPSRFASDEGLKRIKQIAAGLDVED